MGTIRTSKDFTVLPVQNAATNETFADVIGNKTDAASSTTNVASIVGLLRYIVTNLNTDAEVAALIGALDSVTATGAVSDAKVLMSYIKQIVTELQVVDGNVDSILTDTGTTIPALIGTPVADIATDIATVDTVVDAIKAITDLLPDAGALTSIAQESTLGTPVADISTDIAGVKTVVDAITGYALDVTVAKEATIGTPTGADIATDIANVQTEVDKLGSPAGASVSADIAVIDGNVDTLITVTSSTDSSGTKVYQDAGGEQTVIEITNTTRKIINAVWVDCINLTNNGSFKIYYKVDGTNYRLLSTTTITAGTTEALNLITGNIAITEDIKVTYTEVSDEAADRDIPYSVIYEIKE